MNISELTPEEQQTIATYEIIAPERFKRIKDNNFWRAEFEIFRTLLSKGTILDVGAGTGRDAHFFHEGEYSYTGIDLSKESVKIAQEHNPKDTFQVMNMYQLEFPDETFDGIWSMAAYIHTSRKKIDQALQELHRVLKKHGIMLIGVKKGEGEGVEQGPLPEDRRFLSYFSPEEFTKILEKNNFRLIKTSHRTEDGLFKKDVTWLNFFVEAA